jgi:glutamyl-tRNA synthetase
MSRDTVRVRFAPSPTGYLHVGGLRTALYNYLFAKKNGGAFVLRIEDTDRSRYVEGAVENLIDALRWAGLDYDEGPGKGGGVGPYLQSERLEIYNERVAQLIEDGKAYRCFCTPERLDEVRKKAQAEGGQPKYDKHCLALSEEEANAKLDAGEKCVVRLNVPEGETISFEDRVRGTVSFSSDTLDDQVLIKSDGYPTYHLANVVDDRLMGITHVIRGEEWLSSTPKHVLLYQYLGRDVPEFAHLPLLLNPDRSKLSKRQGDVAVEDYRAKGYLPEALVNFVALLGWTAGDDREFYKLEELVEAFSLERVNKAGAVFNVEKLDWLNEEHLKKKSPEALLPAVRAAYEASDIKNKSASDDYLVKIIPLMLERVTFPSEIATTAPYFFDAPTEYDEKGVKKRWKDDAAENARALADAYEKLDAPTKDDYERVLREVAEKKDLGAGRFIHPARLAATGVPGGPGLFDVLELLGKDEVVARLRAAAERLG